MSKCVQMRQRRPPRGGRRCRLGQSGFDALSYGSTAEAAELVGVKQVGPGAHAMPPAGAGPTVQVLLDWLYSSE